MSVSLVYRVASTCRILRNKGNICHLVVARDFVVTWTALVAVMVQFSNISEEGAKDLKYRELHFDYKIYSNNKYLWLDDVLIQRLTIRPITVIIFDKYDENYFVLINIFPYQRQGKYSKPLLDKIPILLPISALQDVTDEQKSGKYMN